VVARVLIEEIGRGKVVWERERGEAWKKRGPLNPPARLINVFSKEGRKAPRSLSVLVPSAVRG
jgi:hypothetical protein